MTNKAAEIDELVARWVRPQIRQLSAYQVADAEGLIKLDAMENPYQWPEALREEWLDLLRKAEINRYPILRHRVLRLACGEQWPSPTACHWCWATARMS